jgi:hypothetical protein
VCQIIENVLQNLYEKDPGRHRYSHKTDMFCMMLKTLSPRTDGFLRQFFPFPQSERVEEHFEKEIDRDEEVIGDVERAAERLVRFRSQFVGDGSDGLLAVDGQRKKRFMLVFFIQPVDHRLPHIVLGMRTDKDGKARIWTDEMILHLKKSCLDRRFKGVAVSVNGAPFMYRVDNLPLDDLFLTDFLHRMKCLRHRLATDLLALCSHEAHDVTTLAQLKSVINVDCSLTTQQGPLS